MTFNSLSFVSVFAIFLCLFWLLPGKARRWLLLSGNLLFCLSFGISSPVIVFACAFVTWGCGQLIRDGKNRKASAAIGIILNIFLLSGFKYSIFPESLLVPVGISFFTLRCISYIMDVYRGTIGCGSFVDVLIWVSFFPQIISGPIERPGNFFAELDRCESVRRPDPDRFYMGALQYILGISLKLVLAERLCRIETTVFSDFTAYGSWEILTASLAYTLYIYCDFLSYTEMSSGISRMIGFETARNFRQPYLAAGIKDFWKRWHMSLTAWLTDYVYVPLGGNRKGLPRKYINIILVFIVSGIWHGPTLNFIFWGLLHACAQIIEDLWQRGGRRLPKPISRLLTFGFVNFAWIFFNSGGLNRGFRIVRRMFSGVVFPGTIPGADPADLIVLAGGLLILLLFDILKERSVSLWEKYTALPLPVRVLLCVLLVWSIILLGVFGPGYDTSGFIYAQF